MFSRRGRCESVKKSHYYVCFLGAKEARGLRGPNVVIPVLRTLSQEAQIAQSIKLTLQISNKGMKIFQPVPMISKNGRIKMEMLKFLIPHYSICYSMVGPPPLNDTVAVVMLIFNPETRCPVHVHCYRCDSTQTAQVMNTALQILISRPENADRFADLELRLMSRGFLSGGRLPRKEFTSMSSYDPTTGEFQGYQEREVSGRNRDRERREKRSQSTSFPDDRYRDQETSTTIDRLMAAAHLAGGSQRAASGISYDSIPEQDPETERMIRMHRALFEELKSKMAQRKRNPFNLLSYPQEHLNTWRHNRRLAANRVPNPNQLSPGSPEYGVISRDPGERKRGDTHDMGIETEHRGKSRVRIHREDESVGFSDHRSETKSPPSKNLQLPTSHIETSSTSGLGSDADSSGGGTNKRPGDMTEIDMDRSSRKSSEDPGFQSEPSVIRSARKSRFVQNSSSKPVARDKALARRYNIPIEVDDSASDIYATPQLRCFGDTLKYEIRSEGRLATDGDRLRRLGMSTGVLPDDISKDPASPGDSFGGGGRLLSNSQEYCDPNELESSPMTSLSPKDNSPNNWITKPSKFFSMEDISRQMSYLNVSGFRGSMASTGVQKDHAQESLWHLPSLVDPFGKRCEQSNKLLTGNQHSSGLRYHHNYNHPPPRTSNLHSRYGLKGYGGVPNSKAQSCWDVRRSSVYIMDE